MTVYGLREEIARRLARCIKTGHSATSPLRLAKGTSDDVVSMMNGPAGAESASNDLTSFGSPGYLCGQILSSTKEQSKPTKAILQVVCSEASRRRVRGPTVVGRFRWPQLPTRTKISLLSWSEAKELS
jgi:hypothetical protein